MKIQSKCFVTGIARVLFIAAAAHLPSAHAANLLDGVQQKKELVVATEAAYVPFEYVEDGKVVGYGPDLMRYILAGLPAVKLHQMDLPFQGILPGLAAKKYDMAITSLFVTKERADKFAFTLPIADATVALLRRKNDGALSKPEDIRGRIVGSQAGSGMLKTLQAYDNKLKESGKPGVKEIKQYVSMDEAYADLAAGRLDAVAQALSNLGGIIKSRPDTFAVVLPAIGPKSYYAWAGRKDADSASLVKFFSDGIAKANATGKMKELQLKWFGFEMPVPSDRVPEPTM